MTHEFVNCEGVKIHIARAGKDPSKQLLLFLHGFPEYACLLRVCSVFRVLVQNTPAMCLKSHKPTCTAGNSCSGLVSCFHGLHAVHLERVARRFWYSWRGQLEALAGDFEVAALDMPGYNASDKPARTAAYVSGNLCTIVAGALTYLGRESCVLVGT